MRGCPARAEIGVPLLQPPDDTLPGLEYPFGKKTPDYPSIQVRLDTSW